MSAEGIALVIGAVATLFTAVAGVIGAWQRKSVRDADALEEERDGLRSYVERLLRHIYTLRALLAEHGIEAPPMPADESEDGAR